MPQLEDVVRSINRQVNNFRGNHRGEDLVATQLWNLIPENTMREREFVMYILRTNDDILNRQGARRSGKSRGPQITRLIVRLGNKTSVGREPEWIGLRARELDQIWDNFNARRRSVAEASATGKKHDTHFVREAITTMVLGPGG